MSKIKAALAKLLVECSSVSTDKAVLVYDGEKLEENVAVYVEDEEGNRTPAEDGEYASAENIIVVENGIVKEIREKVETPEEEPKEEENLAKQEFEKNRLQFEESYDEKTRKIADAIHLLGFEGWVSEAGDDFAVMEVWIEETMDYKHYRFAISWDADGNPIVGDFEEVKPAFVPVDENPIETPAEEKPAEEVAMEDVPSPDGDEEPEVDAVEALRKEVNELYNIVDGLKTRLDEIENKGKETDERLSKVEKTPAAAPAHQEFTATPKVDKTSAIGRLFA